MVNHQIEIIDGDIFKDERGRINTVNSFNFEDVRRCYMIKNASTDIVRGLKGEIYKGNSYPTFSPRFNRQFPIIE